ncbi:hypothetical protein GCM10008921_02920 [Metaclostridioides mangenotii]
MYTYNHQFLSKDPRKYVKIESNILNMKILLVVDILTVVINCDIIDYRRYSILNLYLLVLNSEEGDLYGRYKSFSYKQKSET